MLEPWHHAVAILAVVTLTLGVLAYRGPDRAAGYQISVIGVLGIVLAIVVEMARRLHGIR